MKKLFSYNKNKNNIYDNNNICDNKIYYNNNNDINLPLNMPLLNKIIKENELNLNIKDNKENYQFNQNEEIFCDEVNNIFSNNSDYYSLTSQAKNIHSIKHIKTNDKKEINTYRNIKDLLNTENKENFINLEILSNIKNSDRFSDEIANIIIEKIINTEIKPFSPLEKIIPYKSFKYDILPRGQKNLH